MVHNTHLERLIAEERYSEMLDTLSPPQLSAVALCLDGLDYAHAGELLGVTRQAVACRMRFARGRLTDRFPELRSRGGIE